MFSLTRKIRSQETLRQDSSPIPESEDAVARVAIAEDGAIAYASGAFLALAVSQNGELTGTDAAGIMRFPEARELFQDISAGIHKIAIQGHKELFDFHFDWLTAPDQKRYLVGSEVQHKTNPGQIEKTRQIFEAQIAQSQKPANDATDDDSANDAARFLNLSQDVMLTLGEYGQIICANARLQTLLGYGPSEIQDLNLVDLFHPDDKPYVRNAVQSLNFGQDESFSPALNFEARVLSKSGEEFWMEWRQSQQNGRTYCLGRDVTSIKRQERALNRRQQQLREAESIGSMGRWRWGVGDEAVDWSEEVYRIFGVDKATFKPTLDRMRDLINKRDIARVNQALQRAIIERNDYDMDFRVDRAILKGPKKGETETRFIRCEGRCAVNSEGEAVALYGVMQDVTDRIIYERNLKEAKDAAERAYAAKSQFLANMSHELRTPLNAVIGFSEMMERQLLGPIGVPKYLEYISGIRESGEHLLDIINDLLVMSKIEAGKYELALEEVNVLKTIRLALHMMEGKAMESEVKITLVSPEMTGFSENRQIVADRRAVLQILLNVLSNAVKFSKRGAIVRVECSEKNENVIIKVIDNGIGIPANKLASITKPFEQAQSHYTRDHEGTGLGLAITKDLIEMHGGALMIESQVDVGTSVTVRLPFDGSKIAIPEK